MDQRRQIERREAPYAKAATNGAGDAELNYATAQEELGVDVDLAKDRARMSEHDGLKQDVIVEAALERLDFRRGEQELMRPTRIGEEIKSIRERLEKDGLRAEPDVLQREAETNVEKFEAREIAAIKREARVHLDRHREQALGVVRERPHRRIR